MIEGMPPRFGWFLGAVLSALGVVLVLGIRTGSCDPGPCTSQVPATSIVAAIALVAALVVCLRRAVRGGSRQEPKEPPVVQR